MNDLRHTLLAIAAALMVAACGGGQSSDGVGGELPAPPVQEDPDPAPPPTDPEAPPAPDLPAPGPPREMPPLSLAPLGKPRILLADAGTLARLRSQLASGAAGAVRFRTYVDDQLRQGGAYGFEAWHAALMGAVTGEARYCQWAVANTQASVLAEEQRIAAGQPTEAEYDSYLYVGPLVGNVALVMDWCRSHTTAAQRSRWQAYGNQAVWNVWNPQRARWGSVVRPWSGWSVDNPVNNYYYSFLEATMLLGLASHGENVQAQAWLEVFRLDKLQAQLLPQFTRDLAGGGSREGTGYGTALMGLWRLYDWWEKSTGERVATLTPHTLASLPHFLHSVVPTLDRVAPTGDHARDSTAALFDYHRHYLQVLMRLFPQEPVAGMARSLLDASSVPRMQYGFMLFSDFLYDHADIPARPLSGLNTVHWGAGTGQLAMRSEWASGASYANLICGPYTESHAHRDQGSFVLYRGAWLAQDANLDSHSGIEQDEALHNLVRFETRGSAARQRDSLAPCEMKALADDPLFTYALADATPVYDSDSPVQLSQREFLFLKPDVFIVFDRAEANRDGVQRVFTLNLPAAPAVQGNALVLNRNGHSLQAQRLAPAGLAWATQAWPGLNAEVLGGVRAQASQGSGRSSHFLHVLGLDGAVSSATGTETEEAVSAEVLLRDGRRATVSFPRTGTGGSFTLLDANGRVLRQGPLPTGVAAPPIYR